MPSAPLHPCAAAGCAALLPRGVTRCAQHVVQYEHQRQNYDVRRWYRRGQWKRLRAQVLSEQPLCVDCQREQRVTIATDVHHRHKHDGDPVKFFNRAGLEGLCASHHAAHTARGE